MIVNFVSECEKNALSKTAQILDNFANRIGENTWQTIMTDEGLQTVKKQLRRIATKNTAVLCYAFRDQLDSELVWIVGNRHKFTTQSTVPVSDFINLPSDNAWQYLPLIKSITAVAALFHDWGHAAACFQQTLKSGQLPDEALSHEWVSCLLFHAFINGDKTDSAWLERLAIAEFNEAQILDTVTKNTVQRPLKDLPPLACLISWLILSHHRLPLPQNDWRGKAPPKDFKQLLSAITVDFGYRHGDDSAQSLAFLNGLPSQSAQWCREAKKWATKMQDCAQLADKVIEDDTWRLVLHHARLALMLGDYVGSAQEASPKWLSEFNALAQIEDKTKRLDEHLVSVLDNALKAVHYFPEMESKLPCAQDMAKLKRDPSSFLFSWHDNIVSAIKKWRHSENINSSHYGFFAVNMSQRNDEKIGANAKILRALSPESDSLRGVFALGSKNLTLQTGEQYRAQLGLDSSELAVVIGAKMPARFYKQSTLSLENTSGDHLVDELLNDEVDFDCSIFDESTATLFKETRDKKFLYSPVLACTIESLIAATQTSNGNHYILPCLRLMSSDLVLDEIDCFDSDTLVALGRLIHLAGMLGRKVILSSSKLTQDVAEGYFNAYQSGWQIFARSRGFNQNIGCAWVNESSTQVHSIAVKEHCQLEFRHFHTEFMTAYGKKIVQKSVKHKNEAIPLDNFKDDTVINMIRYQHIRHSTLHKPTGKKVSFGLLNMANTTSCIELAEFLMKHEWSSEVDIKIMLHHSQQVLFMRNEQEQHLDAVLHRENINVAFENSIIRKQIEKSKAQHVIYILVTNSSSEIGQRYTFDWSIIEPEFSTKPHVMTQSLTAYDKKGAENLAGWINACWFLTAIPQALTPFELHEKSTKCHLIQVEDDAWQFVEKNEKGKFVSIEGVRQIEMRELSQHYFTRLWLQNDYAAVIKKMANKKSMAASEIAMRYSEISLPQDAQNGLLYCSAFGMMAKNAATQ